MLYELIDLLIIAPLFILSGALVIGVAAFLTRPRHDKANLLIGVAAGVIVALWWTHLYADLSPPS